MPNIEIFTQHQKTAQAINICKLFEKTALDYFVIKNVKKIFTHLLEYHYVV